jgi:hypothetical protein
MAAQGAPNDHLDHLGLRRRVDLGRRPAISPANQSPQVDTCRHTSGGNNLAKLHNALFWLGFYTHNLEHAYLVPAGHMSKASKETQRLATEIMDQRMPADQRRLVPKIAWRRLIDLIRTGK